MNTREARKAFGQIKVTKQNGEKIVRLKDIEYWLHGMMIAGAICYPSTETKKNLLRGELMMLKKVRFALELVKKW